MWGSNPSGMLFMLHFGTMIALVLFLASLSCLILTVCGQYHNLLRVLFWQWECCFSIACFQWHSLFDFCIGHLVMFTCTVIYLFGCLKYVFVIYRLLVSQKSKSLPPSCITPIPIFLLTFNSRYFPLWHSNHLWLSTCFVLVCDELLGYLHTTFQFHLLNLCSWSISLIDGYVIQFS